MARERITYHAYVVSLLDVFLLINVYTAIADQKGHLDRLVIYQDEEFLSPSTLNQICTRVKTFPKSTEIVLKNMPVGLWAKLLFWISETCAILSTHKRILVYGHGISSKLWANFLFCLHNRNTLVSYGDGWGVFYFRKLFFKRYILSKASWAKWLILKLYQLLFIRDDVPKIFVRTIYNQAGDTLPSETNLVTPSKAHTQQVLAQFREEFCDARKVISSKNQYKTLLIIGNFCESGLSSFENEIAIYQDAFEANNLYEGGVFVKFHPSSQEEKNQRVMELLKSRCNMPPINLDCHKIPIEFFVPDEHDLRVYSFSFSAISLTYLFKVQSHYLLNNDYISEKFFTKFVSYGLNNHANYEATFRFLNENHNNL